MSISSLMNTLLLSILVAGSTFLAARYLYSVYHKGKKGDTDPVSDAVPEEPPTRLLQISKKELELVFDAIPEQVSIIDKNYTIIRVNKSYANFIMQPIKQILGRKCHELLWGMNEVCEGCPVRTTFEKGIPVTRKRLCRIINEAERHFEVSSFPVFNDEGNTVHAIEFTKDITDSKHMIEQLIRSEKLASIGNMTAGIAHEMNNPLSGISGNAANLLKMPQKYGLNEKGISRVTTILNSAARATAIMNDLLHLSHRPEQTSIMVNINALLIKTANAVHINGSQEIERHYNIDEKIPPIHCDPSKIQQVIVHIVTNGMQAIIDKKRALHDDPSYKGKLIISSRQQEEKVHITVADNGIGISDQNRIKIFDPFFSTRPTGQGTGLGLSVSNKIIEEHGGKLHFECLNEMTLFTIIIPFQKLNQDLSDNL